MLSRGGRVMRNSGRVLVAVALSCAVLFSLTKTLNADMGEADFVASSAPDPYAPVSRELVHRQASEHVASEYVLGTDDRVQVTDTASRPRSAVVFMFVTWPSDNVTTCSGFMVGPRLVATAAHCIYSSEEGGWAVAVDAYPGTSTSRVLPFGGADGVALHAVRGWTSDEDEDYDFGAIVLDRSIGTATGTFGLKVESDSVLRASSYKVTGYPGEKTTGTMWESEGPINALTQFGLSILIDVTTGNSGSPLWTDSSSGPQAVGIVSYHARSISRNLTVNVAARINQQVYDRFQAWLQGETGYPLPAQAATTATATATPTNTGTATATATASATATPATGSGRLTAGEITRGGGIGLVVYGGGSSEQLVMASGCPREQVVFWATSGGVFVTFVPGSSIGAVNAAWHARYPNGLPANTPLIARCG